MNDLDESSFLHRRAWIDACGFAPFEPHRLLEQVDHVEKTGAHPPPIVLIDLDSTVYQVAPRTQAILLEAADRLGAHLDEQWTQKLCTIDHSRIGYSLEETLEKIFADEWGTETCRNRFGHLHDYWWERFFSDDYLEFDRPYVQALEFVIELHRKGAHLVYLTGREETKMATGTRRCLERDGFPIGLDRTQLILKPRKEMDDAEYKAEIGRKLSAAAPILASFENEPRNFAALHAELPTTQHVFVDTVCSPRPARICKGGYLWTLSGSQVGQSTPPRS